MKVEVHHRCADVRSYRAERVKSLFNVEPDHATRFDLEADLPGPEEDWQIGVIVGPSGSGKTSLGRAFGELYEPTWPDGEAIIDAIGRDAAFDAVAGALAAVGLGSVPTWLRPYSVLSNGERFRATMARLVCEAPEMAVIDEFSSVVDRQIACIGAGAFSKAWRRTSKRVVLLSCHYDILDWVQPDWLFDSATGSLERWCLRRRPPIELEIRETDWRYWLLFEPHHYLKMPKMIAARCYVGFVDGQPVAHVAFSTRPGLVEARACRLVIMPEWQGIGVGLRFLNAVCEAWARGENRYGRPMPTLFHTSHPGLAAALRRARGWTQVSGQLYGATKARSLETLRRSFERGKMKWSSSGSGFGGHFRAVQGFRFLMPEDRS